MARKQTPPTPEAAAGPGPWSAMEGWSVWFCAALIAATACAAYANSLLTPFIFDDVPNIQENSTIHSLWSALRPPGGGSAVAGRPVVNLSLALNYALGGNHVLGYHIFNLLIHLGAGLSLFGIVRRTLELPWAPPGLRESARPLGFATALLWTVHPLQTESVTFVIQRTESLAGLIYLVALYCFIRGSEPGAASARRWQWLCVAAVFVGVATKEILATAPLVMLLYDRTFLAGSFREAWRQRRWLHLAAVLAWVPLALLMGSTQGRGGTVMIGQGVTAWMSLITQGKAITGYLGLAFWPHPLVVDYGDYISEIVPDLSRVWPQFILVSALLGATLVALVRWPRVGFVGAWFFLILGPSSSFIPLLSQVRAEHRMYLPLAAVVVLVVLFVHRFAGRAAPLIVVALAAALGITTTARNHDYRTPMDLWTVTVEQVPGNPRAHYSLGIEFELIEEKAAARHEYEEALRLEPSYLDPHLALAGLLLDANLPAEARIHVDAAVRIVPGSSNANNVLGQLFVRLNEPGRAQPYFETAVRLNPQNHEAHNNLGCLLAAAGRTTEAIEHYRRSVALQPAGASLFNLGEALLATGQTAEAVDRLQEAVRLQPDAADTWLSYGQALRAAGRKAEAIDSFRRVLQLDPGNAKAAELLRAPGG